MNTLQDFNVNDDVQVQLTDYGRECLRRNHDEIVSLCGGYDPFPLKLPKEDANGWSQWQLWELMNKFGKYMCNGCTIPFNTIIRIELSNKSKTTYEVVDDSTTKKSNLAYGHQTIDINSILPGSMCDSCLYKHIMNMLGTTQDLPLDFLALYCTKNKVFIETRITTCKQYERNSNVL